MVCGDAIFALTTQWGNTLPKHPPHCRQVVSISHTSLGLSPPSVGGGVYDLPSVESLLPLSKVLSEHNSLAKFNHVVQFIFLK